jgi:hypothetical protein
MCLKQNGKKNIPNAHGLLLGVRKGSGWYPRMIKTHENLIAIEVQGQQESGESAKLILMAVARWHGDSMRQGKRVFCTCSCVVNTYSNSSTGLTRVG